MFSYAQAIGIATELAAAATIIKYWGQFMPDPAWSTIFLVLIIGVNMVGVKLFGELEYWFALIKILIVLVFIIIGKYPHRKEIFLLIYLILGILVTTGALGGHTIGFE